MEAYIYDEGDLELLALGALEIEQEEALLAYMETNQNVRQEYANIENHLYNMAMENGISPPDKIKNDIKKQIFNAPKRLVFKIAIAKEWLRYAALILLFGSVAFNLVLLRNNWTAKSVAKKTNTDALLASLPFEESIFEDMFQYLGNELVKQPCQMDFRATKAFLVSKGLNSEESLTFLKNHEGHCDCEVLMNVSRMFPLKNYKHGDIVPRKHMDANIQVSLISFSPQSSFIDLDMRNGKINLDPVRNCI
jgi:hypothetical protein